MCKLFVLSSTNIVPMDSAGLIQIRHYIQGSNWRLGSSGDNLHRYSTSFLLLNTGSIKCIFMTIFKSHLLDSFHMSLSPQFYYLSPILFLSSIHLSSTNGAIHEKLSRLSCHELPACLIYLRTVSTFLHQSLHTIALHT